MMLNKTIIFTSYEQGIPFPEMGIVIADMGQHVMVFSFDEESIIVMKKSTVTIPAG
jgi:hypothetical protein